MQLTPHFTLQEFTRSATADKLGIDNTPSDEHLENLKHLANKLEEVRAFLGHPILVTSAYRCPALNKAVEGSATSDHPNGLAADFHCPGFGSDEVVASALTTSGIAFDQIIFEQNRTHWVHLGIGSRMRQQTLSWKPGKGYVNGVHLL